MRRFIYILASALVLAYTLYSCGGEDAKLHSDGNGMSGSGSDRENRQLYQPDNIDIDSTFVIPRSEKNELKEHRVYYFDITQSMEMPKNNVEVNGAIITLLERAKNELKDAIIKCNEPNTLIDVILFADNKEWAQGKRMMSISTSELPVNPDAPIFQFIEDIDFIKDRNHHTNHGIVLKDFMENRIKDGYINIMYLLSDGEEDEDGNTGAFFDTLVQNADNRPPRYGFFVGLNKVAQNCKLYKQFENDGGSHFQAVKGANLGINLFGFAIKDGISVDNIRNKPFISVPYVGEAPDSLVIVDSPDKDFPFNIQIKSIDRSKKYVTLEVRQRNQNTLLPDNQQFRVTFNPIWGNNGNQLNFPKSNIPLDINCNDQKNRNVEISGLNELNDIKFEYWDPILKWFKWDSKKNVIWKDINIALTNDAKIGNSTVNLNFHTPQYISVLNTNGVVNKKYAITKDTTLRIGFILDSSFNRIDNSFEIKVNINCSQTLEALSVDDVAQTKDCRLTYTGKTKHIFNPWWWLIIAIVIMIAIICLAYRLYQDCLRNKNPKFPNNVNLAFRLPDPMYLIDHSQQNIAIIKSWNSKTGKLLLSWNPAGDFLPDIINISNIGTKCIDKITILPSIDGYQDKPAHGNHGEEIFISAKLNNCKNGNDILTKIELIPKYGNKALVICYYGDNNTTMQFNIDLVQNPTPSQTNFCIIGNNQILKAI